jgi:hypothetical protein
MAVVLKLPCDDTTHRVELDTDGNFRLLDHPDQMAKAFSAFGAKMPGCLRIMKRALEVPPDIAMLLHFHFPVASVDWDDHEDIFYVEHEDPQNEYDANAMMARLALDLAQHGLYRNIRKDRQDAIWEMLERARDLIDKPSERGDPIKAHERDEDRVAMDDFAMKADEGEWQTARAIYWALKAAEENNPDHWFEAYEGILSGFVHNHTERLGGTVAEAEGVLHAWLIARVVEVLEHVQKGKTWPT